MRRGPLLYAFQVKCTSCRVLLPRRSANLGWFVISHVFGYPTPLGYASRRAPSCIRDWHGCSAEGVSTVYWVSDLKGDAAYCQSSVITGIMPRNTILYDWATDRIMFGKSAPPDPGC